MTPMFQHIERETLDAGALWLSRQGQETREQTTDRLVLHGLRCGKRTLNELAFHAGLASYKNHRPIQAALARLAAEGRARKGEGGWEAA